MNYHLDGLARRIPDLDYSLDDDQIVVRWGPGWTVAVRVEDGCFEFDIKLGPTDPGTYAIQPVPVGSKPKASTEIRQTVELFQPPSLDGVAALVQLAQKLADLGPIVKIHLADAEIRVPYDAECEVLVTLDGNDDFGFSADFRLLGYERFFPAGWGLSEMDQAAEAVRAVLLQMPVLKTDGPQHVVLGDELPRNE